MLGLFDSGSGGLTILDAVRRVAPQWDIIYLGDHGHAPYGHRSHRAIVERTRIGVHALFDRGCTVVVLACNTAAAIALRTLQQDWLPSAWPDRRILGVLVPMVEAVTGLPWHSDQVARDRYERVVLFATRKTIASGAYRDELAKRAPHVTLVEQACPGLVDAIEGGAGPQPLSGLVAGYVDEAAAKAAGPIDAAILGCTHFPLVETHFRRRLPSAVSIYAQPALVAGALGDYQARHPHRFSEGTGKLMLLTTGDPAAIGSAVGLPDGLPAFQNF